MDQLLIQITDALRGMWRWRWVGLSAAWTVGIIGAVILFRLPDTYEASARVYVDTQSVLKPLMSGLAVQPNVEQELSVLSRTLISRPNLDKLIRMTDLDLNLTSPEDHERLIEKLMRTLQIQSAGRDNLYTISFRETRPEQATRVVQSLLSIFVESSLGGKRKDSDQAKKFIAEQISVYEQKLAEAENRMKEFKLKNIMAVSGAEGKDYFTNIATLSEQVNDVRMELRAAEQSRDAFKRELAGEDPVFLPDPQQQATAPGAALPEIDTRVDTLKKTLDELLSKYTDQHPDVIGTRRVIADLEQQRTAELERRHNKDAEATDKGEAPKARSVDRNPVYQELKISLADAEAKVAGLRTRLADYEARYQSLLARARMVPEVEKEFSQLNRDYQIQKQNYENLVSRRESAAISGEMEASSGVVDFRVIDPPRASSKPVAPNRLALLPLVLIIALAVGTLVSLAASQTFPVFHDNRSLRATTSRPVLGSVTFLLDRRALTRRRRRLLLFLGGIGSLIASYGAAIAFVALTSRVF